MKIIFSGGGTLGPVTPLLAIYEVLKENYPKANFVWVGTKNGPEKQLIEENNISFISFTSGKLRRYVSFWNVVDLFKIVVGFFESWRFLKEEKPDMCISAGGFVSMPLHWAAWFLHIPTWVHQQDVRVGLSNKLMARAAKIITVALENNLKSFSGKNTFWLGNPVRRDILRGDKVRANKLFNLKNELPIVFVTGGGTGSQSINQLVVEAVLHLENICEIIHLSGKERPHDVMDNLASKYENYHPYYFFTQEMKDAYAAAEIVVSRGGFGTLTEIAALGKAAIIVPKPGHQEENVRFLADANAIILVDERLSSGVQLASIVRGLLVDLQRRETMKEKIKMLMPLAKDADILRIIEFLKK